MAKISPIARGMVIDRRGENANKHVGNVERFRERHKKAIQGKIEKLVKDGPLQDILQGGEGKISIDTDEPTFILDPTTGDSTTVVPGNKKYQPGDVIDLPKGGSGKGPKGGQGGGGEDDFVFTLTRQDMLEYLFNDLELPNPEMRKTADTEEVRYHRAGYSRTGNPALIHISRTFKEGLARRIAARGGKRIRLKELEESLKELRRVRHYGPGEGSHDPDVAELEVEIERIKAQITPFYLDNDLRYRALVATPQPIMQAVMFCLMDVSGSMGEEEKLMAKKFFLLLYLFLSTAYDRTNVVFIRHTSEAEEVDENTFFYGKETGGTVVSSALVCMKKIIEERYPPSEWNIYGAQASDGDNHSADSVHCVRMLQENILPITQYFAYVEINKQEGHLWPYYSALTTDHPEKVAVRRVKHQREIYPVFRKLFQKTAERKK